MPRIGGGGGPIVPPGAQGAQGAQKTEKSDFAGKVTQVTQATEAAASQQAKGAQQSQMTGKVREIAKRLASGQLDQKEATREFVSLVIEERFPDFKKKKKKKKDDEEETGEEQLEEAVTELIDRDPVLAKRLQTQFQKLGKQS
jgi:hypothetical protein